MGCLPNLSRLLQLRIGCLSKARQLLLRFIIHSHRHFLPSFAQPAFIVCLLCCGRRNHQKKDRETFFWIEKVKIWNLEPCLPNILASPSPPLFNFEGYLLKSLSSSRQSDSPSIPPTWTGSSRSFLHTLHEVRLPWRLWGTEWWRWRKISVMRPSRCAK